MKIIILTTLLITCACSVQKTKKTKKEKVGTTQELLNERKKEVVQDFVQDNDFWPAKYYNSTFATVQKPKMKIKEQQLWELCKGPTLSHIKTYEGILQGQVEYLRQPILFYTDSGFKKEVFVTKGMCRELALYSSHGKKTVKIDDNRRLRYKLEKLIIQFVYTDRAFAAELEFSSKYKGVTFTVH